MDIPFYLEKENISKNIEALKVGPTGLTWVTSYPEQITAARRWLNLGHVFLELGMESDF